MATLLQIDSSPLSSSVSRELTREFVGNWKIAHPSGQVIVRDLAANPAKPLDQAWIQAAHTPADALAAGAEGHPFLFRGVDRRTGAGRRIRNWGGHAQFQHSVGGQVVD